MTTYEEQFAALFGKKPDGTKVTDKKFMKYENVGESFSFVITGDMETVPQTVQVGGKDYPKVLVRPAKGQPFKPMAEHLVPEDTDPDLMWVPPGDKQFPVRVLQRKKANGEPFPDFEEFDAFWELKVGNRLQKLEEVLMETPMLLGEGVRVIEKQLDRSSKPYKYVIRVAPPKA